MQELWCPRCGKKLKSVDRVRLNANTSQDIYVNAKGDIIEGYTSVEYADYDFYRCTECNHAVDELKDFVVEV